MGKYTFINEEEDGTINTISGNKNGIDDVLEDFKQFLLGCTFSEKQVGDIWRGQEPEPYNGN